MVQHSTRWSTGKVLVTTILCGISSIVLFVLAKFAGRVGQENVTEEEQATQQLLTLPMFIQILGIAGCILTVLCLVWFVKRIQESRIPPWERNKTKKRRRRK